MGTASLGPHANLIIRWEQWDLVHSSVSHWYTSCSVFYWVFTGYIGLSCSPFRFSAFKHETGLWGLSLKSMQNARAIFHFLADVISPSLIYFLLIEISVYYSQLCKVIFLRSKGCQQICLTTQSDHYFMPLLSLFTVKYNLE